MKSLISEIQKRKKDLNAVILAHNYQIPEVQDLADFTGDSLELSRQAAKTEADVIVFCGVHFMAETASILSPSKTVLLPDDRAGCPMADMITAEQLRQMKAEHPGAAVVCYVNSSAEVKAECDMCCTSSNAVQIVQSIPQDREVLFVPDKFLGQFVARKTGRPLVLWPGYCPTHSLILGEDIQQLKAEHPGSVVMVHPECPETVRQHADEVLSTSGMLRVAAQSPAQTIIVGTEVGLLHRLRKDNPGKTFLPASERAICPNMKRITPDKVLWSLQEGRHEIKVPQEIRERAKGSLDRMVAVL